MHAEYEFEKPGVRLTKFGRTPIGVFDKIFPTDELASARSRFWDHGSGCPLPLPLSNGGRNPNPNRLEPIAWPGGVLETSDSGLGGGMQNPSPWRHLPESVYCQAQGGPVYLRSAKGRHPSRSLKRVAGDVKHVAQDQAHTPCVGFSQFCPSRRGRYREIPETFEDACPGAQHWE